MASKDMMQSKWERVSVEHSVRIVQIEELHLVGTHGEAYRFGTQLEIRNESDKTTYRISGHYAQSLEQSENDFTVRYSEARRDAERFMVWKARTAEAERYFEACEVTAKGYIEAYGPVTVAQVVAYVASQSTLDERFQLEGVKRAISRSEVYDVQADGTVSYC